MCGGDVRCGRGEHGLAWGVAVGKTPAALHAHCALLLRGSAPAPRGGLLGPELAHLVVSFAFVFGEGLCFFFLRLWVVHRGKALLENGLPRLAAQPRGRRVGAERLSRGNEIGMTSPIVAGVLFVCGVVFFSTDAKKGGKERQSAQRRRRRKQYISTKKKMMKKKMMKKKMMKKKMMMKKMMMKKKKKKKK